VTDASPLAGWENFYVIVGSSAGGLTGLTFVVIALIREVGKATLTGMRTFVTPTIVHFAGVLALAAFLSMPHQGVLTLSIGFGVGGIAGIVYGVIIAASMPGPGAEYVPVREDWIFNVIVPTVSYGCLLGVAVLIWYRLTVSLYIVAFLSLLLLMVGIRNAWDTAVWMTASRKRESG
jgi:hypothetical protein